eukprot:1649772-Amphidinium_carterae.1
MKKSQICNPLRMRQETITGMSNAVIVEQKGAAQYALRLGERFAEALIASLNGEIRSRLSPAYSHQSLGACEDWQHPIQPSQTAQASVVRA